MPVRLGPTLEQTRCLPQRLRSVSNFLLTQTPEGGVFLATRTRSRPRLVHMCVVPDGGRGGGGGLPQLRFDTHFNFVY